ncbi:aquaporin [Salmonella enterica subsp. enterica serovar Weltevreden]|nr:aquaporin [Salmonella enterica subsp. enterica serovar Weltevreden]
MAHPAAALNAGRLRWWKWPLRRFWMGMIMALTDDGNGIPKGPLAPLLIGILAAVIGASTDPYRFCNEPARDFGPKLFTWLAGWGNMAMKAVGERSLILSCRLSRLLSAPVPEQPYIAILLVQEFTL